MALSPDIASLNNPGPGLPNYTSPVFSPTQTIPIGALIKF